jgi:hypothetical protein
MLLSKASGLWFCSLGTIIEYTIAGKITSAKSTNIHAAFCAFCH